jgi:flagellar motility protein MotE (MotC chaperone)
METTANEDIDHLVKMYQVMKPKQAAEIFDSMDPAFAAGFLREMNSERAGMIMANMDSRKSYSISIIMAAKNAKYR